MTKRILALALTGALGAGAAAMAQEGNRPAPKPVAAVKSYSGGVLTLTLNDGSTVAGKVRRGTHIRCREVPATTAAASNRRVRQAGPDSGSYPQHGGPTGPQGPRPPHGPGQQGGGQQGPGDRGDDDQGVCDTTSLTEGTPVLKADLIVTGTGLRFAQVVLSVPASADSAADAT